MNEAGSKAVGVSLAVASGLFIGTSFVFKKKGLLQSTEQSGGVAAEGYSYLKSFTWWTGMILMAIGEICNFVAYAFTQAILITPLGALTVVVSAVLSAVFLKERLSFNGKMGCFHCILGSIIIVLHAPQQSSSDTSMDAFKDLVLSPGFLTYAIASVVLALLIIIFAAPRWGKKHMGVYIAVCSLIGAISVVFTQGLGMAIVHSITVANQFTNYFTYVVLLIVIITLIVEIVYLNKALNLFNTALVTPTYYVTFTTLTIVSSLVLYQGFGDASAVDIATCVFGFFCICSGVVLLHRSSNEMTVVLDEHNDNLSTQQQKQGPLNNAPGGNPSSSHQAQQAELLVPLFVGVTRYASTTRKSRRRIRDSSNDAAVGVKLHEPPPPSIPVAAVNTWSTASSRPDAENQQQQIKRGSDINEKSLEEPSYARQQDKHVVIPIVQEKPVPCLSFLIDERLSLNSSRSSGSSSSNSERTLQQEDCSIADPPPQPPKRWSGKVQSRLKRFSAYKIRVKSNISSSIDNYEDRKQLVASVFSSSLSSSSSPFSTSSR